MQYEPRLRNHGLPHDPFKALIAPRPIGWISTLSKAGQPNLAPYSFFNAFSDRPPIVGFSSAGMKDSAINAQETGEFVCNIVMKSDTAAMSQSSAPYPHGVSEFEKAGLEMEASRLVKAPRVKGIAAAFECKVTSLVPMHGVAGNDATYVLVLGEVVNIYIDDSFIKDRRIDSTKMNHLARLGYMEYAAVENIFWLDRPQGG